MQAEDLSRIDVIQGRLSREAFGDVRQHVFDILDGRYKELLETQEKCLEVGQNTTVIASFDDLQAILRLYNKLLQQYEQCYSVLLPHSQEYLLEFLLPRMWEIAILPFARRILSLQPPPITILRPFLQRAQSVVLKLPTSTHSFCTHRDKMADELSFIYNTYVRLKPYSFCNGKPSSFEVELRKSHKQSSDSEIPNGDKEGGNEIREEDNDIQERDDETQDEDDETPEGDYGIQEGGYEVQQGDYEIQEGYYEAQQGHNETEGVPGNLDYVWLLNPYA